MTREIALHCMKSYSELHSDLCELCPIYGQTGSDHCFEDALQYVIGMLEQEPTTKNDLGVDTNKLLADCEKMSFDIEIFNKPLKVVALDAVKNIAKDLINSENPNKSEIPTGSTTKNDLGVDAISRQEVLDLIADYDLSMGQVVRGIHALPSVTPQEPKTGHRVYDDFFGGYYCSECNNYLRDSDNYCPGCGAKMIEPQESEDNNVSI